MDKIIAMKLKKKVWGVPFFFLTSYKKKRSQGQQIEVTDIKNNTTTSYDSIHEAARVLNINHSIIFKYFSRNQKNPYKGKYTFKKIEG